MTLHNPLGKRLITGYGLYKTMRQPSDRLLIEHPLLKEPTLCLLFQIGGLFLLRLALKTVAQGRPHYHKNRSGH